MCPYMNTYFAKRINYIIEMSGSKDLSLLTKISDNFSEEIFRDIFKNKYNTKNVDVLSWDFGPGGAKGDSYLSTAFRVNVKASINDKIEEVNLFIKSIPKNVARRKTFRSDQFFHNEIVFYTEVVPKFQEFLNEKQLGELLVVPGYYASYMDGIHDFLVLEDVSISGYKPATRQSCLQFDQCEVLIKTMAKFHGISFAYKDQRDDFLKITSSFKESYFSNNLWSWYEKLHGRLVNIATDALEKEYPDSAALAKFNSYKFGDLYYKCVEFCHGVQRDHPSNVVTQGDSWAPNFLIKVNDNGEVENGLMLDFQLARLSSPILDLSFFLYSCTDKEVREMHFDSMLKMYYNYLCETINKLGSNAKKLYPWEVYMKEVKEQFIYGLVFALEAIPFSIMPESQAIDLDSITGDEPLDVSEAMIVNKITSQAGRQRLADVIVHATDKGFL